MKKRPSKPYNDFLIEALKGNIHTQLEYIKASLEENQDMPETILLAIRNVAKARGFSTFSEKANLNRENLYRVLSKNGNPRLDTFLKILDALDLRFSIEPRKKTGS